MKRIRKGQFVIRGHFTGSQLRGEEHQFVYDIYLNDKRINKHSFSSKAKADKWLGKFVRYLNELKKKDDKSKRS